MLYSEYAWELHLRKLQEEGLEEGLQKGLELKCTSVPN